MLRRTLVTAAFWAIAFPAVAEVWMMKPSGGVGCSNRERLIELDEAASGASAPQDCVVLYPGERVLDAPEAGMGFNEYMKVQRGDGSFVFVRRAGLVPDPGIGSLTDDRAE